MNNLPDYDHIVGPDDVSPEEYTTAVQLINGLAQFTDYESVKSIADVAEVTQDIPTSIYRYLLAHSSRSFTGAGDVIPAEAKNDADLHPEAYVHSLEIYIPKSPTSTFVYNDSTDIHYLDYLTVNRRAEILIISLHINMFGDLNPIKDEFISFSGKGVSTTQIYLPLRGVHPEYSSTPNGIFEQTDEEPSFLNTRFHDNTDSIKNFLGKWFTINEDQYKDNPEVLRLFVKRMSTVCRLIADGTPIQSSH